MSEVTAKTLEVFKHYKKAAIDFSRRNRLLKYPLKASKVEFIISLEECSSYFGPLDELNKSFDHKKILKDEEKQAQLFLENPEGKEEIQDPEYDTKTLPQGRKLITVLERMRLQSKRTFDESGLHTLFVAFGEVSWKEKTVGKGSGGAVKQQDYIAPLLLVPVSLENKKEPYKATLLSVDINQQPIQINPVLLLFMKENFELRLPKLPETPEGIMAMSYIELRNILLEIQEIFKEKGLEAEISEKMYLGQFSFHGQQIYEDLNKNQELITQHEFINSICGGESFHQDNSDLAVNDEEEFNPDDFLNEDEDYTIVDADGSQIQAIRKIVSGDHMVIHGPPGTGKSQTIANIISNLLARQKKVLFVCEKQVALDVVYKRLSVDDGVAVNDLCLPLFNYTNDKKSFAADLLKSRDNVLSELRSKTWMELDGKLNLRKKKIEVLKSYGSLITQPFAPLNKNLYWVFGELAKVTEKSKEVTLAWKGKDTLKFTLDDYQSIKSLVEDINNVTDLFTEESIWQSVARKHYSIDFSQRVIEALKDIRDAFTTLEKQIDIANFKNLQSLSETVDILSKRKGDLVTDKIYPKIKSLDAKFLADIKDLIKKTDEQRKSYTEILDGQDKYVFPESWEVLKDLDISVIDLKGELSKIASTKTASALSTLSSLKKDIDATIPAEVLDLTIKDFQSKKLLFQIDSYLSPLIKISRSQIYELRNTIKNLALLYAQLQKSQETIEKYGINFSEIDTKNILVMEGIFSEKYKTFFRIFSKVYKANCKEVGAWCLLRKPEKYSEVKTVVFDLASRTKVQAKYDQDWSKVISDYSLDGNIKHLSFEKIQQGIDNLVEYLETNNLEYVEPALQGHISDSAIHIVLIQKTQKIEQIMSSWKSLSDITLYNITDSKLSNISEPIEALEHETEEIKRYHEVVASFIKTKSDIPKDVEDLLKAVNTLNSLNQVIETTKKSTINKYLDTEVANLLTDDKALNGISGYLQNLESYLAHLVPEFCQKECSDLFNLIEDLEGKLKDINKWQSNFAPLIEKVSELFENEATKNDFYSGQYSELSNTVSEMVNDSAGLERWVEYKKKKHALEEAKMGWFIKELKKVGADNTMNLSDIYTWSFFNKWIEDYSDLYPELKTFSKSKYEKLIKEFKELEKESFEINRLRVLYEHKVALADSKVPCEAETKLRNEANKKMRHLPIRTLVQRYGEHIQLMKPCWMVSPLALSSYLEYGKVDFDVVIFDEASQMKIESALGAIARAKQTIVIGDEHQLPPTSFFGVSLDGDEEENEEVSEETGFESILQKSISLLNGSESYLKYHYRSSSEDLIAFSNYHIYENRLITFPNPQNSRGVVFNYVKGVYDGSIVTHKESGEKERYAGSRTNQIEAEEVVRLCIDQVQNDPTKTIGVIAFSKAQEQKIRDVLTEKLSKEYSHLSEYLDETSEDKNSFFIKNLESVQGDERDVIILSICYGPDKTGKVFNRFGPINSASGYRRLNVAVTRAKDKLICVASMHFSDITPSAGARGAILLQKYLEYAEKGSQVLEGNLVQNGSPLAEHDSDFEACVEKAITDMGYTVHRQIGVSGFKIDLAILNPKNNKEYVLGIECDGAAYHSSKSARIRDRMRQDILESRGWKIYRVWSQHWYLHKQDVLNDIIQYVQRVTN
jgi:very-short-patch-repair endonuclease/DNA polymerase III delta prime subunit